jgi:hypothetical protein
MRARAQDLVTRELGVRTADDVLRQRAADIESERPTSLDRRLAELVGSGRLVEVKALASARRYDRSSFGARLAVLARLGLARQQKNGDWQMGERWQDQLKQLGQRGDIIKRLHQVAPGAARYQLSDPASLERPVEGVVRAKGLHDELTGALFAAVETLAGEMHYVPLDSQASAWFEAGDVVRVGRATEPWVKPTDRVLAEVSARYGGVYDAAKHLLELEHLPKTAAAPAVLVEGNRRRLERLERYGLVRRLGDGRWSVPPDLLAQLQSREISHPRHRFRVEYLGASLGAQATYEGPTWLDAQPTLPPAPAPAAQFDGEVRAAQRRRAEFLRTRGLGPASPERERALSMTERAVVGRRIASELGLTYVDVATSFRGTLKGLPPLPSGRAFARVVDELTGRVTVVPVSGDARRLEGRVVEVTVDATGRSVLRPGDRLTRGERP